MINKFIKWAKTNGWNIVLAQGKKDLPPAIKQRYDIPDQWYDFICNFEVCENRTATKWFLTPNDYMPQKDAFQWNEFEIQSLEFTENSSSVIKYWDTCFPIVLCVDGEYSYYAVNTENGNVVYGSEPEYEEATVIAKDFITFIHKVISGDIVL
ncbi:MAG: SMI1/KNR4 family protein [Firmicutes bacterium]|nr:SMI1/KNR4 family protein [Bacillota bacterium]